MNINWKNVLITVLIAYFGILLINKFILPWFPPVSSASFPEAVANSNLSPP